MAIIVSSTAQPSDKGISISSSNVLIGQTPTITDPGTGEVAANISDPDHSLTYTCGTDVGDFSVSYGAQADITYVAISGHTAATPTQATIELYDGVTLVQSVVLKRNNNVMFTFTMRSFSDLIVKFKTVPNNYQMTLSYIAAGQHITILTGEQSGYSRSWLNRHTTQRTATTLEVGPVTSIQKQKALKGSLNFPNQLTAFTRGVWQDFIDFSFEQPFFIKEVVSNPESSYICYDPVFSVKAHKSTRKLDFINVSFSVFNGL